MTEIDLPKIVEIEPTLTCNLRCRMCHVSYMPEEPRPALDPEVIDKLSVLRGVYFIIGSGYEPMMNRGFAKIVRKLTALGGRIELITNGTLMTDENVSALIDADLRQITFSFDGIEPETYEDIRRRSNYRQTVDAILAFRQKFAERDTLFSINSTMMRRNLAEVGKIVEFWDAAGFDLVRFISMVVRETEPELIRDSLYPIREEYHAALDAAALDVIEKRRRIAIRSPWFQRAPLREKFPENFDSGLVHSRHPGVRIVPDNRQQAQLGPGPGMSFPCKSPWTFARVTHNGDVVLCYQFTVGNLKAQSFEEIWFGPVAQAVREKVRNEREVCESCDYFRFCLRSATIDDDERESHFVGPLLSAIETVDFESGKMRRVDTSPPRLVETRGTTNIVFLRGLYLTVPQAIGPIDLAEIVLDEYPAIGRHATLREARRALD